MPRICSLMEAISCLSAIGDGACFLCEGLVCTLVASQTNHPELVYRLHSSECVVSLRWQSPFLAKAL